MTHATLTSRPLCGGQIRVLVVLPGAGSRWRRPQRFRGISRVAPPAPRGDPITQVRPSLRRAHRSGVPIAQVTPQRPLHRRPGRTAFFLPS